MKKMNVVLNEKLNLKKTNLEIGFFKTAKYTNGVHVAQVARIQEFGTLKIPARPFFRRAIISNMNKWINFYKVDFTKSNDNEITLNKIGELARGDIVKSIDALNNPPNAKSTIKQKNSSKPLVDTGLLRRSVTYRVN